MKALVRSTLAAAGYEIKKTQPAPKPFIPYVEHYSLKYAGSDKPCIFDLWITNRDAEQWYKEWFYAAQNPTWELDEFSWLVKPADRVLEIGCHHGFLSLMLAHRIGPGGLLYAIDANPENALIASAQFAQNKLGAFCTAANLAGGERSETLTMEWQTNSHVAAGPSGATNYQVKAMSGDELDAEFGPFNVLKVDVEGFEVSVLKGCKQLLKRKPKIILEVHPPFLARYRVTMDEIWNALGAETYHGTVVTRPNFHLSVPFEKDTVSKIEVSNLHLAPK